MVVPIIGWITAGTLLVVSLTAQEDAIKAAQHSVSSAEDTLRYRRDRYDSKQKQIEQSREDLKKAEKRKDIARDESKHLTGRISTMNKETKRLGSTVSIVRQIITYIKPLSNRVALLQDKAVIRSYTSITIALSTLASAIKSENCNTLARSINVNEIETRLLSFEAPPTTTSNGLDEYC